MPEHVHRRRTFAEARALHHRASAHLAVIDTELEEVIARRRRCLGELGSARAQLCQRWSNRHIRRRPLVDEAPLPPPVADAEPLWGTDLRAVCLRVLRRHGPQRLRDLHGLLHCYGFVVDSVRPVQRLGDAMAYECAYGRARRIERGVYEAVGDGHVPFPAPPGPSAPHDLLPWIQPVTVPNPPHIDPAVAHDPEHWSNGEWPDPANPSPNPDPDPALAPDPDPAPLPPDPMRGDSSTNRPSEPAGEREAGEGAAGVGEAGDEPP